jgi:hypothetical protein
MMKKNNTKKNNTARKLLPAAGMLAVSASMLATSTYAWFTMNKEVQVTGLAMKTKVGSNLLISSDNVEANYKADTLVEGRKALLEPVSSVTANTGSFWFTTDAAADGSKAHVASTGSNEFEQYNENTAITGADAVSGKYKYDNAFNERYGIPSADRGVSGEANAFKTAYGYVDYVFYLKATGDAANQELRMTQCDLNYTYDDATTTDVTETDPGDNAWRIAVFAEDITANGGKGNTGSGAAVGQTDPARSGQSAVTILKLDGGQNFNGTNAVLSETTYGSATYGNEAVLDDDIDAGVTKYYKVLVRVWLEGEDKSCNSATYAKLSDQWTLDLDFKLVDSGATNVMENDTVTEYKAAVTKITKNSFGPNTAVTQAAVASPIEVVTTTTT